MMKKKEIISERKRIIVLLSDLRKDICVRPLSEFREIDESVFFAESEDRTFNICIVENVDWEFPISYYEESADDFRAKTAMMVDIANRVEGNEREVVNLYKRWFRPE